MNRYFVLEAQHTSNDDVNFIKTEQYSLAKALNYYYTRKAAAVVDTTYPIIAISLQDSNLMVIEQDTITTLYNK